MTNFDEFEIVDTKDFQNDDEDGWDVVDASEVTEEKKTTDVIDKGWLPIIHSDKLAEWNQLTSAPLPLKSKAPKPAKTTLSTTSKPLQSRPAGLIPISRKKTEQVPMPRTAEEVKALIPRKGIELRDFAGKIAGDGKVIEKGGHLKDLLDEVADWNSYMIKLK